MTVVGAVGATVATIGTGGAAAPILGGVVGGFVGYGVGKGNENMTKKRIGETKFDHGRDSDGIKQ